MLKSRMVPHSNIMPASVAQLYVRLTGDQEVTGLTSAGWQLSFMQI